MTEQAPPDAAGDTTKVAADPVQQGAPDARPKVPNHEKITSGISGWVSAPAPVQECCSGYSWALGTSLESISVDTAATSIHFEKK